MLKGKRGKSFNCSHRPLKITRYRITIFRFFIGYETHIEEMVIEHVVISVYAAAASKHILI